MKELTTMSPEKLREHIEYCQNLLHLKENERWYELVGNLASAAQELLNEYPNAKFSCVLSDAPITVMEISVDHLAFEDNYLNKK